MSGSTETPAIVSVDWLNQQIQSGNSNVRVLDVSWSSTKDMQQEYLKKHIPGAVYCSPFYKSEFTEMYPRQVPDPDVFQTYVRSLGINQDSHLVVYDTTNEAAGFFIGSHAWWTFKYFGHEKVSVLDGSLAKWEQAGYPTTSEVPPQSDGNFTVRVDSSKKSELDEVLSNLGKEDYQIIDSRPPGRYNYSQNENLSGHLPGAKNIPMASNLLNKEEGTFKSKEELQKVFDEAGVDLSKPLMTYCNSGMSSSSVFLAAHLLGKTDIKLYQAGFTEFSKSQPEKIEK